MKKLIRQNPAGIVIAKYVGCLVIILIGCINSSYSTGLWEPANDTSGLADEIVVFEQYLEAYEVDKAESTLDGLAVRLKDAQLYNRLYTAYTEMASRYVSYKKLDQAEKYLKLADELHHEYSAGTLKELNYAILLDGIVTCYREGFEQCIPKFESMVIKYENDRDSSNLIEAYKNLAVLYSFKQQNMKSLAIYERLAKVEQPPNTRTLRDLVFLHHNMGNYDKSRVYQSKAIHLLENKERTPLEQLQLVLLYSKIIGEEIANKNYPAVDYYVDRTQDIIDVMPKESMSANELGQFYMMYVEYLAATFQEEKLFAFIEKVKRIENYDPSILAVDCDFYESLSSMYYHLSDEEQMAKYEALAANCYHESGYFERDPGVESLFLRQKILLLFLQGKVDEALALQNSVFIGEKKLDFNPSTAMVDTTFFGARHMQLKTKLLIKAYRANPREDYLAHGIVAASTLDSLIDQRASRQIFSQSGVSYETNYSMAAELAVHHHLLKKETSQIDNYLNAIEKSKRLFSLYQQKQYIKNEVAASQDPMYAEVELWQTMDYLEDALHQCKTDSLRHILTHRIDSINHAIVAHRQQIKARFPQFDKLRYRSADISIRDIQNHITEDEQFIVYSYFEDRLVAVNIQSTTAKVHMQVADDLEKVIDSLLIAIPNARLSWASLGDKLMNIYQPTIDSNKGKITVVWPGNLPMIPMELILPSGDTPFSVRYLSRPSDLFTNSAPATNSSKIVAYAYSPTSAMTAKNLLASRETLGEIPGSAREIEEINAIFENDISSFIPALKADFIESVGDAAVAHLALHSVTNKDLPSFSYLLFSDTTANDGRLYYHEIRNMKLACDLVCLSSCNSGTGRFVDGEGAASLGMAFQLAGCNNTVQALWPVNDVSTAELMKYFYRNLKQGMKKPDALSQAKRDFLKAAPNTWKHPYYWAGFIYFGDDEPLLFAKGQSYWIYFIGILLFVVALFLFLRKR